MKIFLATLLFAATAHAAVTELTQVAPKGRVEFEAIGRPSMIKIKGQSEAVESRFKVEKQLLSGEAKIKIDSFKTGIDLRDTHMKEKYLETAKYPDTILKIEALKLPDTWSSKNPQLKDFPFKGKLSLHGVEKEVTGVLNVEGPKLKTYAEFEISITDFAIAIPSYLGIKVTDKVKLKVALDELSVQEK